MKAGKFSIPIVAVGLVLTTMSAFAHHSISAEFDHNKPIQFTGGVVKAVEWVNPHSYTDIEVKEDGKLVTYRVECWPPNLLYRAGYTKDSLPIGTVVSFKGIRAKNPKSLNLNGDITLPDGTIAWAHAAPKPGAANN